METLSGVVIGIADYHNVLKSWKNWESIRAYDAAKASGDETISFEQAVSEIEQTVS